jgi:RNA 2',3'-cyclic 3'-phosphodiesterase
VRASLVEQATRLRRVGRDVAWVAPDNLHVTVKFLGGIDESRVGAVTEALAAAASGVPRFELQVRGLGAFPSVARARVIWAGAAAGADVAARLAAGVDDALATLGFPREARPFTPHITLGRARTPARNPALADALDGAHDFGRVAVARVSLMQSQLSPRGARYTELAGLALG